MACGGGLEITQTARSLRRSASQHHLIAWHVCGGVRCSRTRAICRVVHGGAVFYDACVHVPPCVHVVRVCCDVLLDHSLQIIQFEVAHAVAHAVAVFKIIVFVTRQRRRGR